MGKISVFGLMEISRQRRRIGVLEGATEVCPHCQGAGRIRSVESAALMALRLVDIEAGKGGAGSINLRLCTAVALYVLNHKRAYLSRLEQQRGLFVNVIVDDSLAQNEHVIERTETNEDFEAPYQDAAPAPADDFDDLAVEDDGERMNSRTTSPTRTTTLIVTAASAARRATAMTTAAKAGAVAGAVVGAADVAARTRSPAPLPLAKARPSRPRAMMTKAADAVAVDAAAVAARARKAIATPTPGCAAARRRSRILTSGSIRWT